MKFNNEIINSSEFKNTVSGIRNKYKCFWIKTQQIDNITECKNVICVSSISLPKSTGLETRSFTEKFVSVHFFTDFNLYKKYDHGGYIPMSVYLIPISHTDKKHIENIITDIKTNYNIK